MGTINSAGRNKKSVQKGFPMFYMPQFQYEDPEAVQTDDSEYDPDLQEEEFTHSEDSYSSDEDEDIDSSSDDD